MDSLDYNIHCLVGTKVALFDSFSQKAICGERENREC